MELELILMAAILFLNLLTILVVKITGVKNGRYLDTAADKFADRIRKQVDRSAEEKIEGKIKESDALQNMPEPWRSIAAEMQKRGVL